MAENKRDTFIFYRSFKESIANLSDKERLIMYEAITDFALDMIEPSLTGFPQSLFTLIRPVLEANLKRWRNGCKGGEFGKYGGAPKGNKNAVKEKQPLNNGKTTPNKDKDVNKDKEYNIKNKDEYLCEENKATHFVPPTQAEVCAYVKEKGYSIDPETFISFYESKGWFVGKNKMKDWRAALRTWQKKEKERPRRYGTGVKYESKRTNYNKEELW